jgi:hypothetical protein
MPSSSLHSNNWRSTPFSSVLSPPVAAQPHRRQGEAADLGPSNVARLRIEQAGRESREQDAGKLSPTTAKTAHRQLAPEVESPAMPRRGKCFAPALCHRLGDIGARSSFDGMGTSARAAGSHH